MMEQMTINDLKTGMHVVTRDNSEWVVLRNTMFRDKDILIAVCEDDKHSSWFALKEYNQNMTMINRGHRDLDIVRVYQPVYEFSTLEYKLDTCPENGVSDMLFAEDTMTKAEAEEKFGIRIVD